MHVDRDAIYDLAEASELLGVHPRTLREAFVRGELPARKAFKRWLISGDAILDWVRTPAAREAQDPTQRIPIPPPLDGPTEKPAPKPKRRRAKKAAKSDE